MTRKLTFALLALLQLTSQSVSAGNLRDLSSASASESSSEDEVQTLDGTWQLPAEFQEWVEEFGKAYSSVEEELKRMKIWIDNHRFIYQHNKKNLSYKLGHNHFSDLTHDEFQKLNKLGEYFPGIVKTNKKFADKTEEAEMTRVARRLQGVPDSIDWREKGAVTPVKNQGACGSCWSFSTTGAIEGASFLKTGNLVALSEQNLVDCDSVDLGCNGGLMDQAFQYVETAKGLCSEEDYPYEAVQNECKASDCSVVPGTDVTDFYDVKPNSADDLKSALAQQPVSVAIQANTQAFQFYHSGVLDSPECGTELDHGVLSVGYGTDEESGKEYFIVKNSWSENWGEDGYVKIARESEDEKGICGILSMPSAPVVTV